eukprot:scaffold48817_cov72-Phaeocystis_antarctica.AAC.1
MEREPLRAPLLQAHGRPWGQGQVSGVGAAADLGPLQRRRAGHVCNLCSGGRLRTGPALAAFPMPDAGGLPGRRRPGRTPHDPPGRSLHEQRNVLLRGVYWRRARRARRAATPPLWPDTAGRGVRAKLIRVAPGGYRSSPRPVLIKINDKKQR